MVSKRAMLILFSVVLLNYVAQIPYYLHQYYIPRHLPPSFIGSLLLVTTLAWFLVGYARYTAGKRYGWSILVAFLATQVLFYGHSVLLGLLSGGGVVAQLRTSSLFLLVIFLIGDLNFIVATYYLWLLVSRRKNAKMISA